MVTKTYLSTHVTVVILVTVVTVMKVVLLVKLLTRVIQKKTKKGQFFFTKLVTVVAVVAEVTIV